MGRVGWGSSTLIRSNAGLLELEPSRVHERAAFTLPGLGHHEAVKTEKAHKMKRFKKETAVLMHVFV